MKKIINSSILIVCLLFLSSHQISAQINFDPKLNFKNSNNNSTELKKKDHETAKKYHQN